MNQQHNKDLRGSRHGVPVATYRLQLHAKFGFDDVRKLLPYFRKLGISHLYFSPIFAATPGSMHGYDVIDHNRINPELGGITVLYELGSEMMAHDIGLIQDIVPNHVGIANGAHPWWQDVLRYGEGSRYASYFDIDWDAQPQLPSGVLVYPILGKPFGAALESGEIRLDLVENDLAVRYYEYTLPLSPSSYADVIGLPPLTLQSELDDPAALSALLGILESLRAAERDDADAEPSLTRFRELVGSEPGIARYVQDSIDRLNGEVGHPDTFDRLDAILSNQHYRLAYWRVSGEEINYRRFFDINDLAAIRVEREEVFEETHRLLFELVSRGIVTGVRVDHIDGLYDPGEYLNRLSRRLREVSADLTDKPVPIFVEKILGEGERLPEYWPVSGTTGYDLLANVDNLFVSRPATLPMTETYEQFIGQPARYTRIEHEAKRQIADTSFTGEINVLAIQLYRLAQRHRLHRDNTLRGFRRAIQAVLASFPVYRTYLWEDVPTSQGQEEIRQAVDDAQRREPQVPDDALAFLQEVLLLSGDDLQTDELAQWVHFRRTFQQLSGPVVAKGVEDTTMYRYNRLVSLNEVGNNPSLFGTPPQEVHRWLEARAAEWPHAMSGSSTHDTKRSEDVRHRLDVLSELPNEWRREVRAWSRLNKRHRTALYGEIVPDPNTEYLIYQTLVGSWPRASRVSREYRERLHEYLTKAMREAKLNTSWISPDERYEEGCQEFLEAILSSRESGAFLRRLRAFVGRVRPAGCLNSLSALVLKSLAPGFPDFYQGTELWALNLTDPDNRRHVDYKLRESLLSNLSSEPPSGLTAPEAKLWLAHRLLTLRAELGELVRDGSYERLETRGEHAEQVFAFLRGQGESCLAVAVPRLAAQLVGGDGSMPLGERWSDTSISLPREGTWHDLLSGAEHSVSEAEPEIACKDLFRELPFAVLLSDAG